ncbi:hypothetical protein DPMN_129322 [Dreissena polymorpha]|uniref:Uncharacterized protein n=1 Tax=Dreissena polymorpha TaxID=45954 RepID=A0A9D4H4F9_DREPO|nr:hypothetical protein DPMN_129322 [Dreissena polymorpha]
MICTSFLYSVSYLDDLYITPVLTVSYLDDLYIIPVLTVSYLDDLYIIPVLIEDPLQLVNYRGLLYSCVLRIRFGV